MHRYALALLLIACSSPATQPPPKLAPRADKPVETVDELSPALQPLAWIRGSWALGNDASEHWVAAGGALYGVGLMPGGKFEVMIVDDAPGPGPADGVLRFYAMPGGEKSVEFQAQAKQKHGIVFANPDHDHPKTIGYFVDVDGRLHAELTGDAPSEKFDYTVAPPTRAPALEAADRAFSADTAKRGIDGWMAAFEPTGWMLRKQRSGEMFEKITGMQIAETMALVLKGGTLSWAPLASGVSGDIGFTVGTATFTAAKPEASRGTREADPEVKKDNWRSSYVTIWAKQPDGTWKVRFDTGRVVNEG